MLINSLVSSIIFGEGCKNMKFKVKLEPCEEGGYTIWVPALPGCFSQGETIDECMNNIREAIELYLESMEDEDKPKKGILVKEISL